MNFKTVSDAELLSKTKRLAADERRISLEILRHLQEIDDRLLHAKEGYPSLFAYCTEELGYSSSAAQRRIQAARLLKSVPEAAIQVEDGKLNLSQLASVQTAIRAERKSGHVLPKSVKLELLRKVSGQSSRDTERVILAASPALQKARQTEERVRAVTGELSEVKFSADSELIEMLEQAKALFACPQDMNPSIAKIVKAGLKVILSKKQREKLGASLSFSSRENSLPTAAVQNGPIRQVAAPTARYIPASLKRAIQVRAKHRCEYVSPTGRRCESQHALEFHHLQNFSEGGAHTVENLAVYCHHHNAAQAQADFPWLKGSLS